MHECASMCLYYIESKYYICVICLYLYECSFFVHHPNTSPHIHLLLSSHTYSHTEKRMKKTNLTHLYTRSRILHTTLNTYLNPTVFYDASVVFIANSSSPFVVAFNSAFYSLSFTLCDVMLIHHNFPLYFSIIFANGLHWFQMMKNCCQMTSVNNSIFANVACMLVHSRVVFHSFNS